jgi:ribosomal protein L11 methyltransferase
MLRLAVRVRREDAELVLAELLELAPSGVEEVAVGEREIEYAVFGPPGELPALPELEAAAGEALITVRTEEVADDWSERWREFHQPLVLEGLTVRPPWTDPGTSSIDLVIDPGQAFGTGAHASTRLCLELMLELAAREPARGPLLDVGTGSGVLAIAAARLGFAPVVGIDHERESILAARHNAAANGVAIELHRLDLRSTPLQLAGAGDRTRPLVVVANLLRPLLLELARALPRPPRHLIAGGLLAEEIEEVTEVFATRLALRELRRRRREEWVAVWLSAP